LKEKNKNKKRWVAGGVGVILLFSVFWLLGVRLEGQQPEIRFEMETPYVGKSHQFSISLADSKSGLRKIWVAMVQDGKEVVLADQDFPSAGMLRGGEIKSELLNIAFEPERHEFSDGKATLRLAVWDYSWRDWFRGNQAYLEKSLTIDTQPPEIEVISRVHNLAQGGAGLVIFRTSEDCRLAGVQVGDNFFPAHAGYFNDPQIRLALIALTYQQDPETEIWIEAVDGARNRARAGISYFIRKKAFKNDKIEISDRFLKWKVPEFEDVMPPDSDGSLLDKFLKINRDLRKANYEQIIELTQTTATTLLWRGKFLRMPGSANQAGFADHRAYYYNGKIIDRQVHLGMDLASVTHAPVPAANSGVVIFSGNLGIYGNTVLIDHGLGLFSMYAHLSRSDVRKGQEVSTGDILGLTGSSGLAGGDHLHFSIVIHNTFVNPVEWWDAAWIRNNVLSKIEAVPSALALK
jgi:murein DD-endopeptidase MepM/ murein hydrolase activator NlpD